jgi:putative methyltransferase (TIGR04325 family)
MSMATQIWQFLGRPRSRAGSLEFVAGGWAEAASRRTRGWNASSVVDGQSASWNAWRRLPEGTEHLGTGLTASPQDLGLHNTLVSFAYVAALAALGKQTITILDWGGGAGQYGWLAKAVLPGVDIAYSCRDLPVQCAAGRRLFPEGEFFEDDAQFHDRRFDLVCASGALQYVEDWQTLLGDLAGATERYLYITRLPVVQDAESYVVLQRAYDSEYLGWTLNRSCFLEAARDQGLTLVREFLLGERHRARGAPEPGHSRGFLFKSGG